MDTKFTKGEWHVDNAGDVVIKGSGGYVGYPSHDGAIASLDDGEYIENDNKYDAHLIAAAPDMYAMVNEVLSMQKQWHGHGMETHMKLAVLAKKMELLLSKARGE